MHGHKSMKAIRQYVRTTLEQEQATELAIFRLEKFDSVYKSTFQCHAYQEKNLQCQLSLDSSVTVLLTSTFTDFHCF